MVPPPASDDLAFYATSGLMTALPSSSPLLDGLPTAAEALCQLSKELIVHEFMTAAYGVTGAEKRLEELEIRPASEIAETIGRLDPEHRPLSQGRPPQQRLIGNCRQFSVLTSALLRRAGHPARARAGFSAYLDRGKWTDHWIVERWDAGQERWIQTDSQLDEEFRREIDFEFDPLDLPEGEFITGGQAWQRCRAGQDDPALFGLDDLRGLWFVQGSVIRDLASINKVELLPWDVWGAMAAPTGEIDAELTTLTDDVARVVVSGKLDEQQEWYSHDGLRVPKEVFSARFQRTVEL
jgi:hypothetical protein